jgi:hypothetical protein
MFACERSNALVTSPNEVAANAAWADTVEFDDQEGDVVEDVLTAADAVLDTAADVATEVAAATLDTAAEVATAAAAATAAASTAAAAVVPPDDHVQA